MGKMGKRRKRQMAARRRLEIPIPPCIRTRDGIHRDQPDAHKCRDCNHHHCQACGICMRCRRYGDQRCLHVGELKVPLKQTAS